jgi:hypothetical protein
MPRLTCDQACCALEKDFLAWVLMYAHVLEAPPDGGDGDGGFGRAAFTMCRPRVCRMETKI